MDRFNSRDISILAEMLEELRPQIVDRAVSDLSTRAPATRERNDRRLSLVRDLVDLQLTEGIARVRSGMFDTQPTFPPLAEEMESQLARDGVPVTDALIALQVLHQSVIRELLTLPDPAGAIVRKNLTVVSDTLSRVTEESSRIFVERYREAANLWNRGAGAGMTRRVSRVLEGRVDDPAAIERSLQYPVCAWHAAGVAWSESADISSNSLRAAHHALRKLDRVTSVLLPVDEREFWWWVALSTPTDPKIWAEQLQTLHLPIRAALSSCARGVEGFRSSHDDAVAAAAVAKAASHPKIVLHRDVAPVAFLAQDRASASRWVEATLGRLSDDTPSTERLRQTLLVHLRNGGDVHGTAHLLFIHRNTVNYRLNRAEELLPRPLSESRLDVALALEYRTWFQ